MQFNHGPICPPHLKGAGLRTAYTDSLARRFPGVTPAADFHARYLDAGTHLALPSPHPPPGANRG